MPFPEVNRVIYRKNPLQQVICQLRFPPILRIDAEVPAGFQDRVRTNFPNYAETTELRLEFPQGMEPPIPPEAFRQLSQSSGVKNYEFSSEDDGNWKINLTRTFIALTTKKYERWEGFRERLVEPLSALTSIYSPTYFSRIGLRYIDVIRRSQLNLDDVSWTELLQPHILGTLGEPIVGNNVQSLESNYEIRLSDNESRARLVVRLLKSPDDEQCFMIDSDYYNMKRTDINRALEKLDYLNKRGSRLIRWCITNRLHEAMEPQEI